MKVKKKFIVGILIFLGITILSTIIVLSFILTTKDENTHTNKDNKIEEQTDISLNKKEQENQSNESIVTEQETNKEETPKEVHNYPKKEEIPKTESSPSSNVTPPQETNIPTTPPNNNSVVETPKEETCTPKKFYSIFRADFTTFEKCNQIGNEYKQIYNYYGFYCDYQTDDCGTTYYMLTMFDTNGKEYGYNTIPSP